MLGVALAFSVHLINASALDEFSSAVRSVNGQPDLELRAGEGSFDEALFARVAADAGVARRQPGAGDRHLRASVPPAASALALRVLGVDALSLATLAPALMPLPGRRARPLWPCSPPTRCSSTPRAQRARRRRRRHAAPAVGPAVGDAARGRPQSPPRGPPLAVMDIGAAQELFGRRGQLTRIDVRLQPGADRAAGCARWSCRPACVRRPPGDAAQRVTNLSRAYRVNLTVLALVALFTGAFLVFSVLALSRRAAGAAVRAAGRAGPDGAPAAARWCWPSRALLGAVGSALGIALGTALAAAGAALLGGDLGGGYFAGVRAAPALERRRGAGLRPARRGRGAGRRLAAGARARSACRWRRPSRAWATARAARRAGMARPGCCWRSARAGAARRRCRHSAGRLRLGRPAAGRRHHAPAGGRAARCTTASRRLADRLLPLLARGARAPRARNARRSRSAAWSLPEPGGGADGDGRELSRFGHATGSTWCCRPTCTCARATAPAPRTAPGSRRRSCRRSRSCPASPRVATQRMRRCC